MDLFAGVGGFSLGLARAGYIVAGSDTNPIGVSQYREYVGPAILADVRSLQPIPSTTLLVADLPSAAGGASAEALPNDPDSILAHVCRIVRGSKPRAVVMTWHAPVSSPAIRSIAAALESIRYTPHVGTMRAADYGVPHLKKWVVVVGFRYKNAWQRWRIPRPTHQPKNYRTVREAIRRPYDAPAPALTPWESCVRNPFAIAPSWKPKVATEKMAVMAGTAWVDGGKTLSLLPSEAAILCGLPAEWEWPWNKAKCLHQICQTFPPVMAELLGRKLKTVLKRT